MDLLNPLPCDDEDILFNNPDPYGAEAIEDEEGEEDEEDDIVCRARRLKIDNLVDLSNPALLARYDPQDKEATSKPGTSTCKLAQKPKEWVKENWSAADLTF